MSNPQQQEPSAANFEVPDLEPEPPGRSRAKAAPLATASGAPGAKSHEYGYSSPSLFEEDSSTNESLSLELDERRRSTTAVFGGYISFEDPEALELEPIGTVQTVSVVSATCAVETDRLGNWPGSSAAWPTGRAADPVQIKIDPVEVAILADYCDSPRAAQLTPAYAFRVFKRQRELKRQLLAVSTECERAQVELETTLADLSRAVRPEAERVQSLRRFFTPLLEIEQARSQHEQALSSFDAQLSAESAQIDLALGQIATEIGAARERERNAVRVHDERQACALRADAKRKRVQIEMRAVAQVAEHKHGTQPGRLAGPDAAELASLAQRALAIEPEVTQAQAELDLAKQALHQIRAQLQALRQSERQASRKRQALGSQYQSQLEARGLAATEHATERRRALAELGRAVLAAGGSVEVSSLWLERVRAVNERADQLIARRELQRSAIDAYDRVRVTQGVRLVCTAIGLIIVLIGLKLAF